MNLASKQLFAAPKYGDRQMYYGVTLDQIKIVRRCCDVGLLRRAHADKSLSKTTRMVIANQLAKLP